MGVEAADDDRGRAEVGVGRIVKFAQNRFVLVHLRGPDQRPGWGVGWLTRQSTCAAVASSPTIAMRAAIRAIPM